MEKNIDKNKDTSAKLCKKGMVIERCTGCVFETLCSYEENVKKNENKTRNNQN